MNHNSLAWVLLAACSPVLVACGESERDPVSASELALTAQENVERVLRGAYDAGSFIAESASVARALSSVSGEECAPVASTPCPVGSVCPEPEPSCEDAVTVSDLEETREEVREAIDELVKFLKEEVFIAENLEAEDDSSATYLLRPERFCEYDAESIPQGSGAVPEPEIDEDCVDQFERLQPRLRLTSPREGSVDVAVLLTAQKRNPATLELEQARVGVVLNLGELKASLDALGEETEGLVALTGKLELELVQNAVRDYSLRTNVLEALGVTADVDGESVAVSLGPSKPTAELRFDGNRRELTGRYDYGTFAVHGPLNAFRDMFDEPEYDDFGNELPRKTYTGNIDLSLAGLEGQVVLDGSRDQLNLKGLGLGDASSTLKLDGTVIAQLDVNPQAGRHFDLSIESDSEDRATLGFSPTFDVSALLNFAPLASQIADLPDFLLGDTIRVWFDGNEPSIRVEQDQVRVLSGTLNMSSTRVPSANISVPAGSCLLESNAEAPEHELLGELRAGVCQ